MSSTQRAVSLIPRNGAYVTTGSLASAGAFNADASANTATGVAAAGVILTDMGLTKYVTSGGNKYVLRKVQRAITQGDGVTFYINIGGDGTASPVARL